LLRQGTAKHSADELAALLDRHAISLSGGAGHETSVITAGTLSQYLDLTVETLAEVTRTPTFEPPEFRRHIQQALAGLSVSERDGAYLADRALRRRLYGDHYLGRLSGGESSSIRTLEREDLITFHETHYAPNHSMLIFSGAVSSRQATDLARKHFGDWPRKTVPTVATETIPEPGPTTIYLVDRPDATQTQVRIGQLGFPRQDSAYVPAQVFNQVFGGGFSSRLMRRVRIIEGLTYGARGGFSSTKVAGHLSIRTFTRNEETAKTVRVLLDETRKMRSDPPTDEEMNDARSYIIGRFGLSLETPQDVASKIFELRFFGLGENYYDTFLEQIDRVTPDDVTALAERRLDPDRLTIILVGKAADFEHDLDGIAPIVREAGP
jgi:zinc protease